MAPKKRKSVHAEEDTVAVQKKRRGRPPKASPGPTAAASSPPKRKSSTVKQTASSSRPKRISPRTNGVSKITRSSKNGGVSKPVTKTTRATKTGKGTTKVKTEKATKSATKSSRGSVKNSVKERRGSNVSIEISQVDTTAADSVDESEGDEDPEGPAYWLMKAEPESRIEKGKDVKFSIDDLNNASEPEAWDGVRNATARNNMRVMMKGDMAFFYHSNCKVPGIVGTMEIVEEHSIDESAFDPQHPYYDSKSVRENPKWCCVKVAYRQKFPEIIRLKELQRYAKEGGVLANMQTLKMARLSVSKVTKKEWDFIMGLVETEDESAP